MKMTGNTILITGGSSGIGMELARQLAGDNVVIITGRDRLRLEAARAELGNVHVAQSDASDPKAIAELCETLTRQFPALNVLVNNAGIMRKISLRDGADDLADVTREIETNLNGPIRMVAQFLPHLKQQSSPAIVNVSSGLAFVPFPLSPIYSAAKAGVHAFTLGLRFQLKNTNVKVFELAPPGTETPLFRGDFDKQDLASANGMDVRKLATLAISGLKKDVLEIRPGLSNVLKILSRLAPGVALNLLGQTTLASLDRIARLRVRHRQHARSAGRETVSRRPSAERVGFRRGRQIKNGGIAASVFYFTFTSNLTLAVRPHVRAGYRRDRSRK